MSLKLGFAGGVEIYCSWAGREDLQTGLKKCASRLWVHRSAIFDAVPPWEEPYLCSPFGIHEAAPVLAPTLAGNFRLRENEPQAGRGDRGDSGRPLNYLAESATVLYFRAAVRKLRPRPVACIKAVVNHEKIGGLRQSVSAPFWYHLNVPTTH